MSISMMEKDRPYIICHMLMSVDGKICGPFMDSISAECADTEYERINETYHPQAWLCGRVTTDEKFTFYRKPDLKGIVPDAPEADYIAIEGAGMYYVSIDPQGRIGWKNNTLHYANRPKAHIIEVLTEQASNTYRAFLQKSGISYIVAGNEHLDCLLACKKLKELFGIGTLMISGGGYINGSFLNAGLIDELSLVIAPVTDSSSDTVTLFEKAGYLAEKAPVEFLLASAEVLRDNIVWLRYKAKENSI